MLFLHSSQCSTLATLSSGAVSVLIGVVLGYAMDWTVRMTAALHAKFRLHGGGSMASTGDRRSIQREEAISGNLG